MQNTKGWVTVDSAFSYHSFLRELNIIVKT